MTRITVVGALSAISLAAMASGALADAPVSPGDAVNPTINEATVVLEKAVTDGDVTIRPAEEFVIAEGSAGSFG